MSDDVHIRWNPRGPEVWTLDQPYERQTSIGPIVVPRGFCTDGASVPNTVWRAFPRWGRWSGAAVVHDYLYRTQPPGVTRYEADRVMLELMKQDGVHYGEARMIYRAVREFGDAAWRSHQPHVGTVAI